MRLADIKWRPTTGGDVYEYSWIMPGNVWVYHRTNGSYMIVARCGVWNNLDALTAQCVLFELLS